MKENFIETIKNNEATACELFEFSEVIAIMREPGEVTEKLALAFTLGFMRGSETVKEV